jgi:hypothetical protein
MQILESIHLIIQQSPALYYPLHMTYENILVLSDDESKKTAWKTVLEKQPPTQLNTFPAFYEAYRLVTVFTNCYHKQDEYSLYPHNPMPKICLTTSGLWLSGFS